MLALSSPNKESIALSPPDATVESAASPLSAAACESTRTEYETLTPRVPPPPMVVGVVVVGVVSPSTRQTVFDVGVQAVFTPNSHFFPA